MTTRFKTAVVAGLVAVSTAGVVTALAQDSPAPRHERRGGPGFGGPRGMRGPDGPMMGPMFRGLDLTEDQQAQLRTIREARQAEFKAAGDKVRTAREGLRALIESDTIDESAIRAKAAEVAAAEADVAILNATVRREALQVLTPEQQQKLKEFREQRGARVKPRSGPRGA